MEIIDRTLTQVVYLGKAVAEGTDVPFVGYSFSVVGGRLLLKTDGTHPNFELRDGHLFVEQAEDRRYYIDENGHLIEERL